MDSSHLANTFFDVVLPVLAWLVAIYVVISWGLRRWEARLVGERSSSLSFPLSPLAFLGKPLLVEGLVKDPVIQSAIKKRAAEEGVDPAEVEKTVRGYTREIVPAFKAVFYFSIGYWLARAVLLGMYRVRMLRDTSELHARIGPDATVVLFMNHRSNMDVLLVNFLLARDSTVAHSAGEWARLWPLHYLNRLAGNYVIDRDARDPLYRLVLKRFVQMAVTHGIHLGIFPEGGLTRDGNILELHYGLLNYAATASWPGQDRDVVFIPISFNYDLIPEQNQLVFGDTREFKARGKFYVLLSSLKFCLKILLLPITPRQKRYGWACASFGEPVSLKSWQRARGIELRSLSDEHKRKQIGALGRQLMESVADKIPVLPINLLSVAMLEQPEKEWTEATLFERGIELRRALEAAGAPVFTYDLDMVEACTEALSVMERLGLVQRHENRSLSVPSSQKAMLHYYANSISHYLDPLRTKTPTDVGVIESAPTGERANNYLSIGLDSYERVRRRKIDGKGFYERLYEIFLSSSPLVAEKFSGTDMVQQQIHLKISLEHMQDFFISGKPSERMRQIARSHSKSGNDISAALYDLWLEGLIGAVREYDENFDSSVELSWRAQMAPGIAYMRGQYESADEHTGEDGASVNDGIGIAEGGIACWIDHWGHRTPGKVALKSEQGQRTYGELAEEVLQLATGMREQLGIEAGDRVAILGPNRLEFITLTFACARLGAILVPINFRLAAEEQKRFIARTEVKAVFLDASHQTGVLDESAGYRSVLFDTDGAEGSYRALLTTPGPFPANQGRIDSPLFIIFTSGSTGDPKGVLLTQGAVHWNALNSRAMHDMKRSDHVATTLPFFHVGGINVQTLPALQVGATVSVLSRFDAAEFLEFVHKEKPTLTVLVPAQMQSLMKLPGWESTDMTSLRAVTTGSTIVDKDLIRAWANKGVPVIQIYGCTESSPIAVHQTVEGIGPGLGTVGHAALYTELRVADDQGRPVQQGREGEILLRGPNIMGQYWRDKAATRAAFREGWLLTGDLGYQDQDGRLHIVGRKKRLIISGGENIHPAEIEQVLGRHPGIQEAAVIGFPDPEWGEVPVAVVSTGKGNDLEEDSIRRHLDQHLGRYKHPRHIVITDSLPRTGLEKIAYPEIGAMVEEYLAVEASPKT